MGNQNRKGHVSVPEDLFSRVASGDEQAFEELYYLTYKPIYSFLLSLTLNKEDADDLLQDTFIRIRAAAHLYKKQGNPMGWMMKVAKNLFLMKIRKEKGKETVAIDDVYHMIETTFQYIENVNNKIFLQELFLHISEEEREIIVMNVITGLTFREISEILDKPMGTILSKYHRAMRKLRKASYDIEI